MYIPRRKDEDLQQAKQGAITGDEDYEEIEFEGLEADEVPEFLRSKSNLDRMANASELYSKKAMALVNRLMTAQDPNLIDRETLREVVNLQRVRFFGCLSLPFSLAFFLFFASSAYLHEDITNVYMIESGLRKVFSQKLAEVDDIPRMWEWIRNDTLAPELFDQTDVYGNPEPNKTFWSRVLTYNQLAGPLVLDQARSKKERCGGGKGIIGDMYCYPQTSSDTAPYGRNVTTHVAIPNPTAEYKYSGANVTLAQRESYYDSAFRPLTASRRLRPMRTEYQGKLPTGSIEDNEKYQVLIYPNTPRNLIDEHLTYLYKKGWLDAQTKQVVVKALLLNAEVGRPRLEQLQVIFSFSRGGGVFTRMTMESLFLEFAADMMTYGFDFLWVICLTLITGFEIRRIIRAWRNRELSKRLAWTLLQWLIIVCGWSCIFCFLIQDMKRKTVRKDLEEVIKAQTQDVPAEDNKMGKDLLSSTEDMLAFSQMFRLLLADYHLFLMLRFFTAFHSQPRLGVVTSTLQASLVDIIHFLVVLLPTFMAYAISGCFIFGRRMEEFSTFNSAMGICFKMAMEGEYDWDKLSTEHYWTAALWTWTFMLLIVLLMLNMVLAIVMDVYTEMRKNAGASETVIVTLKHFIQRIFLWRRWVSNRELLGKIEAMNRLITREELLQNLPGMCDRQLNALITACRHQIDVASSQETELKDSMKMTMAIKLGIDQVNEEIAQLYESNLEDAEHSAGHKFEVSSDEKRGWLQETAEQMAAQNHWMLSVQWQLQQLQWQWQSIEAIHGADVRFDNLKDEGDVVAPEDIIL
jgi:hypothetical protein